LIQNDSLDVLLLKQRASLYLDNSQLDLAKKDIDNAYTVFRNDVDLLLMRGIIYYQLNQTRISKESWERCVSLNPNHIECRTHLTELLCAVRDGNCKSMIDTLSLLNNGIVSTALIAYLKELKDYNSAITLLNNLFLNSPNDKEILSLLSLIHSDTSSLNLHFNVELAEQYFEKIIFLYPDYFQVYYNFGKHKQNLLQYNQALSYYDMVLELDSAHRQTYYNMGFCNMQLKKYDQSISCFTKAINLDNSFLMAYHARAYVHELNNNMDKAKIDWKNCLMLNPSYIPALEGLNK
jgi:tetratricopeptide (TPR) repeat protein